MGTEGHSFFAFCMKQRFDCSRRTQHVTETVSNEATSDMGRGTDVQIRI